jgi:mannose-6-phosphate isomerase
LRGWIETQDVPAIQGAMNRVPVQPGDSYIVPGGVPHALGAGVFLVEIQEPSDLVVRFEFERGGYVLPESARFMNQGLEFALDVFDLSPWPPSRVAVTARCPARRRRALGPDSFQEDLIGPERTPCFRVRHSTMQAAVRKAEDSFHLLIVTAGAGTAEVAGETHALRPFDAFFVPAGLGPIAFEPSPHLHVLECYPPD